MSAKKQMSQATIIGRPPPETWQELARDCIGAFGGGHQTSEARRIFHHGIQTVFNLLEGEFPSLAEVKGIEGLRAEVARLKSAGCKVCGLPYGTESYQFTPEEEADMKASSRRNADAIVWLMKHPVVGPLYKEIGGGLAAALRAMTEKYDVAEAEVARLKEASAELSADREELVQLFSQMQYDLHGEMQANDAANKEIERLEAVLREANEDAERLAEAAWPVLRQRAAAQEEGLRADGISYGLAKVTASQAAAGSPLGTALTAHEARKADKEQAE